MAGTAGTGRPAVRGRAVRGRGGSRLKLLAVTVLTSMDADTLRTELAVTGFIDIRIEPGGPTFEKVVRARRIEQPRVDIDPITLEVIRHGIISICDQIDANITRWLGTAGPRTVLLHIGSSVIPGTRLKYCDPIHLDDVAVDFPGMTIAMAHGGDEAWVEVFFIRQGKVTGRDHFIMQGAQNELALRQTVRHLSELDAKDQQIFEAIGMMSMFAGLPAATRAMEIARDVLEDGKDEE